MKKKVEFRTIRLGGEQISAEKLGISVRRQLRVVLLMCISLVTKCILSIIAIAKSTMNHYSKIRH